MRGCEIGCSREGNLRGRCSIMIMLVSVIRYSLSRIYSETNLDRIRIISINVRDGRPHYSYPKSLMNSTELSSVMLTNSIALEVTKPRPPASGRSLNSIVHSCFCGVGDPKAAVCSTPFIESF